AAAQLEILDGSCGPEQGLRRAACAAAWAALRHAGARLERLAELAGARERQLDLLEFELAEIEQVEPDEDERAALVHERDRLRNLERLRAAAWGAEQALADDDAGGLRALLACGSSLDAAAADDGELAALAGRGQTLALEGQDLLSEIRRYGEELDGQPGRLEVVEERLSAIARLERKYGGTVAAVLEHAARCR